MNKENFGDPIANPTYFAISVALFAATFYFTRFRKVNPIVVMLVCGIIGLFIF